jgi:alpha-D-ribose 1-methylphosphonate 5-triphosphate synthase subunit PhnI
MTAIFGLSGMATIGIKRVELVIETLFLAIAFAAIQITETEMMTTVAIGMINDEILGVGRIFAALIL